MQSTGENVFIGLRLNPFAEGDQPLHLTLAFIEQASNAQLEEAWARYTRLLANRLPLTLSIAEMIKVGRDNNLDAYSIRVDSMLRRELEQAYRDTSVRSNSEFPDLLLHVTVDSDAKKEALRKMGSITTAGTLYISTAGDERRVLRTLEGK